MRSLCITLLCLWPVAALAQEKRFEITPHFGFQTGGSFDAEDFEFGRVEVDVESSPSYGLTFDIPITANLAVELLYFRHSTDLDLAAGTFGPTFPLGDSDLSFFHGGVLWQGVSGQARPFFSGTGGVTRIAPDLDGTGDDYRLSISLGGGVKLLFTDHLGARFEGRFFFTDLGEDDRRGCCHQREGDSLVQAQLSAGLIFAF